MKLDGFGIFVKDMRTMVEFYRDVLGFEIEWDGKDPSVLVKKDGTLFMFYSRRDIEAMTGNKFHYAPAVSGHFETALSVQNFSHVDEAFARVTAKGAKPVLAPTTEPWGQRTCYVADPEGNLIEIGSFGG
jgi:catechol 2,3-dioxygenase-like lactoylglutathione lyase family enzyme